MADLSLGPAPESERESDDARLRMVNQQISQKKWIFWIGALAACSLAVFFMCLAWQVIHIIKAGLSNQTAWPMVAIGSITLLSVVTILISLARFAYGQQSDKQADDDDLKLPQLEAIKSVVEITKALKAND